MASLGHNELTVITTFFSSPYAFTWMLFPNWSYYQIAYVVWMNNYVACIQTIMHLSWGGGYYANLFHSVIFPVLLIFKTPVTCCISHLYLTCGTTAELRWHLSNMNVIQRINIHFAKTQNLRNGETNQWSHSNPTTEQPATWEIDWPVSWSHLSCIHHWFMHIGLLCVRHAL